MGLEIIEAGLPAMEACIKAAPASGTEDQQREYFFQEFCKLLKEKAYTCGVHTSYADGYCTAADDLWVLGCEAFLGKRLEGAILAF